MNTNLNFRVPKQLLADFEQACQKNYTNKSEVLRQAMVQYIKENQGGSEMGLRTWKRDNYKVKEVEYDYSLHAFEVIANDGNLVATITPPNVENMKEIIEALDDGEEVDGWEDGMGNTISIPKVTYLVQMVKGTDNAYDETATPRTLLETHDKQEALDFFETLPEVVDLEEPETDLEGNEKYESPVLVMVDGDEQTVIKG